MSAGDWKEMHAAATRGDLNLVRYHIQNGVNPNYQHPEIMSTPLVASILNSHQDISLYLLDNGADPNLLSEFDNMTPFQAIRHQPDEVVFAKLVEQGMAQSESWFGRLQSWIRGIFKS
ncbi:ankyrin repeat domain-containing protein [Pseudobdellovibrio exovorus]|nr:ankyrin repeat domain-containing protein [Pseudobdellovibrio exovorus]